VAIVQPETLPRPTVDARALRNPRRRPRPADLVVAVAAVVAVVVLWHEGRRLNFYFDEWNWITGRRSWTTEALLEPHNGHLSLVPIVIYRAMFSVFGIESYRPYLVLALLAHLLCCTLLWLLVRRRVATPYAVGLVVSILFLGRAWQDLLWPFQIGYLASVAGGLGAFLLLERRTRRADTWAAVCLAVSLASSGLGIPIAGGMALELLWERRSWRRLWVAAIPVAMYGLWYLRYGVSQAQRGNVDNVVDYTASAGAGAAGALFGEGVDRGRVILGALLALLAVAVLHTRNVSPRLAATVAMPVAFWGLTALSRAQLNEPAASRYLYPGAILVALALAEAMRGLRAPPLVVVLGALVLAHGISTNLDALQSGAAGLRTGSDYVGAELAALEIARPLAPAGFVPDPFHAPQIQAGPYFAAIDEFGSPADASAELAARPDDVRRAADGVLVGAMGVHLAVLTAPARIGDAAPTTLRNDGGTVAASEPGCLRFTSDADGSSLSMRLPTGGLLVTRTDGHVVQVSVRTLAEAWTAVPDPNGSLATASAVGFAIPVLPTPLDWQAEVSLVGAADVCALARS
jgi:hypothetical protein